MKKRYSGEEIIKQRLNAHESPVPSRIWEAIEQDQHGKRPFAGMFWLGALALSLLLAGGVWYFTTTPTLSLATSERSEQPQITPLFDASPQHSTVSNSSALPQENVDLDGNSVSAGSAAHSDDAATNPIQNISAPAQPSAGTSGVDAMFDTNVRRVEANRASASSAKPSSSSTLPTEVLDQAHTKEETDVFDHTSTPTNTVNAAPATDSPNTPPRIAEWRSTAMGNIARLPLRAAMLETAAAAYAVPDVKCAWEGRKWFFYTDLLVSLDIPNRTLTDNTIADNAQELIEARNTTETLGLSSSAGMRFTATHRNGFAFRTGLIYSQINENFSKLDGYKVEYTVVDGDTLDVQYNPIYVHRNNRYKMLDIPLLVGFEIDTEKYNLGINAGTYLNLLFDQSGLAYELRNGELEIQDLATTNAFRNQLGLSFYGSLNVNYKLTPALHILFEPYGRYFNNSFTTTDYPVRQEYFTAGLITGLRFKF